MVGAIDIAQKPFGIATKPGDGFGEVTPGVIRPDQPHDRNLGLESSETGGDVAGAAGTPFET